jgi:hypothetical protein
MKLLKHPATVIAALALFAALSGVAGATVSGMISGSQIKNHSIPVTKLSASAISSLKDVSSATNVNAETTNSCDANTASPATWCGLPTTVTFGKKTAALVVGSLDFASSNGSGVSGEIGICYAPHGSASLVSVQHVSPDFVAPTSSYFAQAVNGFVKGLPVGSYDVGVCVKSESANAYNGRYAHSVLVVQTP